LELTITSKRGPLKILHYYFGYPEVLARCDILKVHQVANPPVGRGWKCQEFYTLHLELNQSCDQLLRQLKSGTRHEILRARNKDGLVTRIDDRPTDDVVERFVEFYNQNTHFQKINTENCKHLVQLARLKSLTISSASNEVDGDLGFHAYMVNGPRARLLLSVINHSNDHCERAQLGRANRMLHWQDICHFKSEGLSCYDLGGLYIKGEDHKLLQVARFKACFGGKLVKEYKCTKAMSLKGRVALGLQSGINEIGELAKKLRTPGELLSSRGSSEDSTRTNSLSELKQNIHSSRAQ